MAIYHQATAKQYLLGFSHSYQKSTHCTVRR